MENQRKSSYTNLRVDVFRFVPETATDILDVGYSNGELGAALLSAVPARNVTRIEADPRFCKPAKARLNGVIQADLSQFN